MNDRRKDTIHHQTSDRALGVCQEYLSTAARRYVTLTDARLVSIAALWPELPDAVRDKIANDVLVPREGS